jgi:hypothetical protein
MAMDQANDLAYPRTGKRGVPQQFPRRLYNMLESEAQLQLERSDAESLIAWSETGKAFRIEDVNLFSTLVLPKYFRTNKFSSFQRNLNLVSDIYIDTADAFVTKYEGDNDVTNPLKT